MSRLDSIVIHRPDRVKLPEVETGHLSGVPYYLVRGGSEPVVHLELIFRAGRGHAGHPLVASAAASMLTDGTSQRSSAQISEEIEFLGATLKCTAGTDAFSVSLYCMSRHFAGALEVVEDVLANALFPEDEITQYKKKRLQKLRISSRQNEYLANVQLSKCMFGDHVYGYTLNADDITGLSRDQLLEHKMLLGSANLDIFLCGMVDETHLGLLEAVISLMPTGIPAKDYDQPAELPPAQVRIDAPQKLQCAIRLGRRAMLRSDPGFARLFVLNTLLGGYFGSRLMKTIREEHGLTYGIYSSVETLAKASCLVISTEAMGGAENRVLKEIYAVAASLRDTLVSEKELDMVRNYIMGNLMMQLDGPLKAIDVVKTLVLEGVAFERFEILSEAFQSATAQDLRDSAQEYLDPALWHSVVVA